MLPGLHRPTNRVTGQGQGVTGTREAPGEQDGTAAGERKGLMGQAGPEAARTLPWDPQTCGSLKLERGPDDGP